MSPTSRVTSDPESARFEQLLKRLAGGEASEPEREELALYAESDPSLAARVDRAAEEGALGRGWLARVRADDEVANVERSPRTRGERRWGLGLLLGGWALSWVTPVVGASAAVAGLGLLLFSFLRVAARTHSRDPYKDIER